MGLTVIPAAIPVLAQAAALVQTVARTAAMEAVKAVRMEVVLDPGSTD